MFKNWNKKKATEVASLQSLHLIDVNSLKTEKLVLHEDIYKDIPVIGDEINDSTIRILRCLEIEGHSLRAYPINHRHIAMIEWLTVNDELSMIHVDAWIRASKAYVLKHNREDNTLVYQHIEEVSDLLYQMAF